MHMHNQLKQVYEHIFGIFRIRFDTGIRYVPLFVIDPSGSRNRRWYCDQRYNITLHSG